MVPRAGLEPARSCLRGILSPLCLPIPPPGLTEANYNVHNEKEVKKYQICGLLILKDAIFSSKFFVHSVIFLNENFLTILFTNIVP